MISVAVACAVLAAVCNAFGARLQHAGVRGGGLRLGGLARNRDWLRGVLVLAVGAGLQIVALTYAPVSVVAPIVVLALPVLALLDAGRLDRASWAAVLLTCLAVTVIVTVSGAAGATLPPDTVLDAGRLVLPAVVALALLAGAARGVARCVAAATAAGAAYGLMVVLIHDVTYTVRVDGELPVLSTVGVLTAFLAGAWLVQLGYASGPANVVVGTHTVVNPLTATVVGMTVLGEAPGIGGATLAVLATCAGLAVAGVAVLARRPAAPPLDWPVSSRRTGRAGWPA